MFPCIRKSFNGWISVHFQLANTITCDAFAELFHSGFFLIIYNGVKTENRSIRSDFKYHNFFNYSLIYLPRKPLTFHRSERKLQSLAITGKRGAQCSPTELLYALH